MMRRLVAIALLLALSTTAFANHTIMVMPVDGDADPALRKRIDKVVDELARGTGDEVTTANTTYRESAAAVGCDPQASTCADTVIATLAVDEIIFGTATSATATVSRVAKGRPRQDQTIALGAQPEAIEPALRPLFGGTAPEHPAPVETPAADRFLASRDHQLGFALVASSALVFIIGLALWSSESSTQTQIDNAPTSSPDDVKRLLALEDRASSYAWEGNTLVVVGLVAAGIGTYYFARSSVHARIAPTGPVGTGAAVTIGGRW